MVLGTLIADPVVRIGRDGVPVARLRVREVDGWGGQHFHSVVASHQEALYAARELRKGSRVSVEGHIIMRTVSESGRRTTELLADTLRDRQAPGPPEPVRLDRGTLRSMGVEPDYGMER